jgi:hypothetical protein
VSHVGMSSKKLKLKAKHKTKFKKLCGYSLVHLPFWPSYSSTNIYIYIYNFLVYKFQLKCHMTTFDYAMCHNLRPFKMNNHNGWSISIYFLNHQKIFILPLVKFWWMDEQWCHHDAMVVVIAPIVVENELLQ